MSDSTLTVGPGDAVRCALGLLLPAWFYTAGAIIGISAALGLWSSGVNVAAAVVGFAVAAGVEVLRRVVLATRPGGGQGATAALRAAAWAMLVAALPIIAVLAADLFTQCFGTACGGGNARIPLILWLVICALLLLTAPLTLSLLRRSAWLQPRG